MTSPDPELSAPSFEPGPPPTPAEQQDFVSGRPPMREDVKDVQLPAEFDPRWRDPFVGLLYVGRLESSFTWLGHRFLIRTLKTSELIDVALVVKPYNGTEADLKAYQAAVTAACLVTMDDEPLPFPDIIKGTPIQSLTTKFQWVIENLFPPLLDVTYEMFVQLDYQVQEVIKAMTEAAGGGAVTTGGDPPGEASG